MGRLNFRQVVAMSIAGSMLVSSTAAIAAPVVAPTQQIDPWAALSVLSAGAPAAALCGSAATVSAPPAGGCVLPVVDAPLPPTPPPPPPPPPSLWPALGAIAAIVGAYFLLNGHKSHPVSPA